MSWPQYTLLGLYFISLLLHAHGHGKPRTGNGSVWIALLSASVVLSLLWAGGFFAGGSA